MVMWKKKSGHKVFRDSDGVTRSVAKRVLEKKLGRPLKKGYDADHIRPVSKGGSNRPSNLRELPFSVNRSPKKRKLWK